MIILCHVQQTKTQLRRIGGIKYINVVHGRQWNPNPRIQRSSGKRGIAEFSIRTMEAKVGIYSLQWIPMIDYYSSLEPTLFAGHRSGKRRETKQKVRKNWENPYPYFLFSITNTEAAVSVWNCEVLFHFSAMQRKTQKSSNSLKRLVTSYAPCSLPQIQQRLSHSGVGSILASLIKHRDHSILCALVCSETLINHLMFANPVLL